MKRAIFLAGACLALSTAAVAQPDGAQIFGMGTSTCAQFASVYSRNQAAEPIFFAWAQGFISSFNISRAIAGHSVLRLDAMPLQEQQARIREYCDAHPLADYLAATQYLIDQLIRANKN